jgi:hypothetical protein
LNCSRAAAVVVMNCGGACGRRKFNDAKMRLALLG